jgi:hypothetical protein
MHQRTDKLPKFLHGGSSTLWEIIVINRDEIKLNLMILYMGPGHKDQTLRATLPDDCTELDVYTKATAMLREAEEQYQRELSPTAVEVKAAELRTVFGLV